MSHASRPTRAYNPLDIAWAAGLFEGEGSISPINKIGFQVAISMTDEDVIRRFAGLFPFGTVRPRKSPTKPLFTWRTSNAEHVQAFLAMVWPWLGDRRRARARDALLSIRACKLGMRNNVKVTWAQVREIRRRSAESYAVLSAEFGIAKPTISEIVRRKRWVE